MKSVKERILSKLDEFNKLQGITFISKKDAEDYFKGLTTLVEYFYVCGREELLRELIKENKIK